MGVFVYPPDEVDTVDEKVHDRLDLMLTELRKISLHQLFLTEEEITEEEANATSRS